LDAALLRRLAARFGPDTEAALDALLRDDEPGPEDRSTPKPHE
jgi:hypothetical protein